MPRVTGFLPSTSGLHFSNSFPRVPLETVEVPGVPVHISLGDASQGLCGGMVYTVRDYFESGQAPPPDTSPPGDGPLFDYIVKRLIESWDLPGGILRYLYLMSPDLPDHDTIANRLGVVPHGRAGVMIDEEWPKIKDDLDYNHLSPLGLIKCKSADPALLGQNHQVLAYGYDLNGTDLTLHLYDPNVPDRDDVSISLSLARSDVACQLTCTTAPTLYCFFRSNYTKAGPPPEGTPLSPGP
jgi:hypothetical protein